MDAVKLKKLWGIKMGAKYLRVKNSTSNYTYYVVNSSNGKHGSFNVYKTVSDLGFDEWVYEIELDGFLHCSFCVTLYAAKKKCLSYF